MTIIEFYDKSSIENIAGALLTNADRVIFVGDNHKVMERSIKYYNNILSNRGKNTVLEHITINRNNLFSIVDKLSSIIEKYDDCVFDVTGGEDLCLVAVGILTERYKGKIQCHRFNFSNSRIIDCDADGNVISLDPFNISIEENLMLYGGKIVKVPISDAYTYEYDYSADAIRDIERMWNIAKKDIRKWNAQCFVLADLYNEFVKDNKNSISYTPSEANKKLDGKYYLGDDIIPSLEALNLISVNKMGSTLTINFKNDDVRHILTGPGRILEIFIAERMRSLTDDKGNLVYNEVASGVVMNWELEGDDEKNPTINEVDVIAMKDALPVFVSCKTGKYGKEEIYKLHTVSEHFGNKYAKCAIISTSPEDNEDKRESVKARANEMDIAIIENVDKMTDAQLSEILRKLYTNDALKNSIKRTSNR